MKKNAMPFSRVLTFLPGMIILLAAIGLIYVVVYPKFLSIQTNLGEEIGLKAEVLGLNEKVSSLTSIDDGQLSQLENKAEIAVPVEKTFTGLLTGLDALSKEAGSSLLTFGSSPGLISTGSSQIKEPLVGDSTSSAGLRYLEATISLSSSPGSLISLANKLATSGRLVTLQSISYNNVANSGVNSNTSILLRVYYQPANVIIGLDKFPVVPLSEEEKQLIAKVDSLNRFSINVPISLPLNSDPFQVPQTIINSPAPRI